MPTKLTDEFVRSHFGDRESLTNELNELRESAAVLSDSQSRLIEQFQEQWVAIHSGEVKASEATYSAIRNRILEMGLPANQTIVRYIDKHRRTLIL